MSDMTPDLPPHLLAKRKRQQKEESSIASSTASGANRAPSPDGPEKRRKIGPALPDPSTVEKQHTPPRRIAGPALPPARLDERPTAPPPGQTADDSSDDSDDDYGPALPSTAGPPTTTAPSRPPSHLDNPAEPPPSRPKRDDWMMMPPQQDDLAARLDPLKARPSKFAGKNAHKGDTDNSTWHETPEQKQKRLQDEMMGISNRSSSTSAHPTSSKAGKTDAAKSAKARKDEEAHRIINSTNRGPSLLEQHSKAAGGSAALDDDPSKRAFDREKDMGGGVISASQRKQMLNKAQGFAGKFAGGSYL